MPTINRRQPPRIVQSQPNSCWAAVLESWSRVEPTISVQQESILIRKWGEGKTCGITPVTKLPQIARVLALVDGGFRGPELAAYLTTHLPRSHVFCAFPTGVTSHAVLIYRFSENGVVSYMDPQVGEYRWDSIRWFSNHRTLGLMRRA